MYLLNHTPYQWYAYLRRRFSSQRLQHFDQNYPCIFTLSTGRVGTQTLAALLRLAPNVFAYHEPEPYLFGLSKIAYHYASHSVVNRVLRESFRAMREGAFNYALSCYKGYVETSPQGTFLAPAILEVIPEVKFIHLVRNPGAVVRSGMRRNWYAGHPSDPVRITPLPESEMYEQWDSLTQFQKNVWLWTETNRWIARFLKELSPHRFLLVQSEKLFEGDPATLDALFRFVAAPPPSLKKIEKVLSKKLNRQKSGVFPEPEEWPDELYEDLCSIAGPMAEQLGYDL